MLNRFKAWWRKQTASRNPDPAIPPLGDDPIPPGSSAVPYPQDPATGGRVHVFTAAQKGAIGAALRDRHVGVNAAPVLGPALTKPKEDPAHG